MQLYIEPTPATPEVLFDLELEKFSINGRSMPEDAESFYLPIINWLKENVEHLDIKANLDVKLEYYNTGSFIRLMEIFNTLEVLNERNNEFSVRWLVEKDDLDNINDGESFKDVVKIPFKIQVA